MFPANLRNRARSTITDVIVIKAVTVNNFLDQPALLGATQNWQYANGVLPILGRTKERRLVQEIVHRDCLDDNHVCDCGPCPVAQVRGEHGFFHLAASRNPEMKTSSTLTRTPVPPGA